MYLHLIARNNLLVIGVKLLVFIVKTCRQIDRILVHHEFGLLHETLVLIIEDIFHEVVFQEPANPESSHQQADITRCHCKNVQRGIAQM